MSLDPLPPVHGAACRTAPTGYRGVRPSHRYPSIVQVRAEWLEHERYHGQSCLVDPCTLQIDDPVKRRLGTPLVRPEQFGAFGAGARGNQKRQRPLAPRGVRGWQQCCAGHGFDGLACCSTCTPCTSTYQGVPPRTARLAGSTYACARLYNNA